MKKNNSEITPSGYDSYELWRTNEKYCNLLIKKSWIRRKSRLLLLAVLLMVLFMLLGVDIKISVQ